MARTLHKLTAREVATLSKAGRHSDGGGLYLCIDAAGRRRWTYMTSKGGQQTELGLGSAKSGTAGNVSLADARRKATQIRDRLAEGLPPLEEVQPAAAVTRMPTFGEIAAAYLSAHGPSFRNAKHLAQWESTLANYAAELTDMPVDQVAEENVLACLEPIWQSKSETASRVRGRIEAVLDYARARKLRTGDNPARWRGHLEHVLPARQRLSRGHHAAVPYKSLPKVLKAIGERGGVSPAALQFTILTAARSGEVRGAIWGEIDLEGEIWTVPAERMKAGREHRVPLSKAAVAILLKVKPEKVGTKDLVFHGPRTGRPLSDMTLSAVLRRMNVQATVHGFRSSFRDWAGDETTFDRDTIEAALAHTIRDATERAYRRGSALEKRRQLMADFADFCMKPPKKVSSRKLE